MFTRHLSIVCLAAIVIVMATAGQVDALPTQVSHVDDPNNCDFLFVPQEVDELGIAPTFTTVPDELIDAVSTITPDIACLGSDNPLIPNTLVEITNLTGKAWKDLWYVTDPRGQPGLVGTSISNSMGLWTYRAVLIQAKHSRSTPSAQTSR
jgi:hypothetical protein